MRSHTAARPTGASDAGIHDRDHSLLFTAAHGAEVPRDGIPLDPDDPGDWILTTSPGGDLPGGLSIGGSSVDEIVIHPRGVLVADDAGFMVGPPTPLAGLPPTTIFAPFWAPLSIGACGGGPAGEVRLTARPAGVRIAWHDVPLAGCPGGARATFSVELVTDGGVLRAVEMRYEALPEGTLVVDGAVAEPRAGINLRASRAGQTVLELLPDPAGGVLRGRAKRLVDGSSDGAPGVWRVEVDAAGEVLGDPDRDGRRSIDNCERDFNPLQEDLDGDERGDACDRDRDGDGIRDVMDNCPSVSSPNLTDLDGDGLGDVCDPDDDNDGLIDGLDLCPRRADPANLDLDRDGRGDVCDHDADGDDWLAVRWGPWRPERCPLVFDPFRGDWDGDGLGDWCDLEPDVPCRGDCADQRDTDGDWVGDTVDVCPFARDPDQADGDRDGIGDACDPDRNNDGTLDIYQLCAFGGCDPIGAIEVIRGALP